MRHLPAMFRSGPIGLPAHHDHALRAARPEGNAFYNWYVLRARPQAGRDGSACHQPCLATRDEPYDHEAGE